MVKKISYIQFNFTFECSRVHTKSLQSNPTPYALMDWIARQAPLPAS